MKLLKSYIRKNRGATVIEFAVILPVYLLFIFGIIELGYIFWGMSSLHYGASFGARFAFINPGASSSQIEDFALSFIDLPGSVITYEVTTNPLFVDIDGTFTYNFLYLPIDPISVQTHVHQVLPLPVL